MSAGGEFRVPDGMGYRDKGWRSCGFSAQWWVARALSLDPMRGVEEMPCCEPAS